MERRLRLDIVDNCNLRCISCQIHAAKPKSAVHCLDFDLFVQQTRGQLAGNWDVVQLGCIAEPMIHPDFGRYMEYLSREFGGRIHIVTNGVMLSEYVELLNRIPCQLSLSMDSVDPDVYARIRRGSRWERIVRGLDMLDRKVVDLAATFTLMRSNIDGFQDAVDFCAERGLTFEYQPMCLRTIKTAGGSFALALDHMLESLLFYPEKVRAWNTRYIEGREATFHVKKERLVDCSAHEQHLMMLADGKAYLCFKEEHPGLHTASLHDIWHSPRFEAFRGEVNNGRGPCRICDYHRQCLSTSMRNVRPFLESMLYAGLSPQARQDLAMDGELGTAERLSLFYREVLDEFPIVHMGKVGGEYRGVIVQSVVEDLRELDPADEGALDRLLESKEAISGASREGLLQSLTGMFQLVRLKNMSRKRSCRVLVWGTSGGYENDWRRFVEDNPLNLDILGFVDASPLKWGHTLSGLPIHAPDELAGLRPDAVIIASCYVREIREEVERRTKGGFLVKIVHKGSFGNMENWAS